MLKQGFCAFLCLFAFSCYGNSTFKKPKVAPLKLFRKGTGEVSRIVNGHLASAGDIPYQAAIIFESGEWEFFCGGSLISNEYVLTAAHCVESGRPSRVYLGGLNINANEPERVEIPVADSIIHSDYSDDTLVADIAVVHLSSPVTFNSRIQSISLPSAEDVVPGGVTLRVSGYGATSDSDNDGIIDALSYADLVSLTQQQCINSFGQYGMEWVLCAQGPNGESSCNGDSGGPLAEGDNGQSVLVGIVSFGGSSCDIGGPTGYTRITYYRDWITQQTGI